jgi:hypothetical protein
MKPYIVCHMNTSADGRTWSSRWRLAENRMAGRFERIHNQLGNGPWLIGRATGSEAARGRFAAPRFSARSCTRQEPPSTDRVVKE